MLCGHQVCPHSWQSPAPKPAESSASAVNCTCKPSDQRKRDSLTAVSRFGDLVLLNSCALALLGNWDTAKTPSFGFLVWCFQGNCPMQHCGHGPTHPAEGHCCQPKWIVASLEASSGVCYMLGIQFLGQPRH